jgi:hypothetical protein
MSATIAALAATLVVVFINRNNHDTTVENVVAPLASTSTVPPVAPAVLDGTFDVTATVVSAEYGATWPHPQLVAGQQLTQSWSVTCRLDTCVARVVSGHVPEDPDGASVSTTDGHTFAVSSTTPASADPPNSPPGCGTVDATDTQQLTLTAVGSGSTFTGQYVVHHPTIHVEGPVLGGSGSCDSFNAVLQFSGTRHA